MILSGPKMITRAVASSMLHCLDVGSLAGAPRWRVQTAGIGREERAKTTNADTLTIALVEPDHWPKKSSTARPAEYADVPPASCKPSPLR
jgi:hypothetical protein